MEIYLVGGAVRDKLLGYPYSERDWVVVGGSTEALQAQGFESVGKDFPVFLHPDTKEEYALARRERKTAPGYAGFAFETGQTVSLEDDLSRRDLTINAIAENNQGQLVDPFGGQNDLNARILRHVSPAFVEDPVRILRVARFAARYHHLGFRVAEDTLQLMRDMVDAGEVDHLVAERVWKEFERALGERSPHIFIQVLRDCGALGVIMPELDALFGVPQPEQHHPEIDTGVHVLLVLEQAALLSPDCGVRFAALMHDLGKALTPKTEWPKHHGHEALGLSPLHALCERLKVPMAHRALAELVVKLHTHCHRARELKASTLLENVLLATDAYRKPERFEHFLLACKADSRGRPGYEQGNYPQANYLLYALKITAEVSARAFVEKGLKGKAIGEAMNKERLARLKHLVTATQRSRGERTKN